MTTTSTPSSSSSTAAAADAAVASSDNNVHSLYLDDHEENENLQSLIRVRNRLAVTSDDKLPRVLSNLLPRLLQRFDRTNAAYYNYKYNNNSDFLERSSSIAGSSSLVVVLEQQILHYTGIFAHVLDRIRLAKTGEFCETVMPILRTFGSSSSPSTTTTNTTITMALSLLQAGLPYYYYQNRLQNREKSNNELDLTPLMMLVHETHQVLHQCAAADDDNGGGGGGGGSGALVTATAAAAARRADPLLLSPLGSSLPSSAQMHYRMSGSLLLEAVALAFRLGGGSGGGGGGGGTAETDASTNTAAAAAGWEELRHWSSVMKQPLVDLRLDGVFHFVLDILLFWPATTPPPHAHNNNNHRIRTEDGIVVPDNLTGLSTEALNRLNHCHHHHHQGGGISWNTNSDVCLRQLKFVMLQHALLGSVSNSDSGNDDDDAVLRERRQILAVLAASTHSMHGRLATNYLENLQRHQHHHAVHHPKNDDDKSPLVVDYSCCSPSLATNLLILVLGEQAASEALLQSHDDAQGRRFLWEPVLGPQMLLRGKDVRLVRSPLPLHFAVRAVNFVLEHFSLRASFVFPNHPPNSSASSSSTSPEQQQQSQILLLVVSDLVAAIQNMKERDGFFWGIQLMSKLYSEIIRSAGSSSGSSSISRSFEDNDNSDNWRQQFCQSCLATAKAVLSALPDRSESSHHRGQAAAAAALDPMEQDHLPLGVPEPYGRRGDLEMLVNNHRKSQKNRFLQRSDAVSARSVAYALIAELARLHQANYSDDSRSMSHLGLCIAVFKWVPFEDEANQASLNKSLDSLLVVACQTAPGSSKEHGFKERTVYALIPHLLVAACSESSNARLLSLQWSSQLVAAVEPEVAAHICGFLSNDVHDLVSRQARCITGKLKVPPISSSPPPRAAVCDTAFLDARLPEDRIAIANDLKSLMEPIQCEFGLEASSALAVLVDHNFNKKATKESLRKDKAGALTASGLGFRCGVKVPREVDATAATMFSCDICYDDELDANESYALPCKHVFCRTCWDSFLKDRLATRLTADRVYCPRHDCDERVLICDIAMIQEEQVPQWHDVLLCSFVEKSDHYTLCTGPDCTVIAHRSNLSPTEPVSCPHCTASYCFACRQKPHQPAACHHFEQWHRIYSSSKFWIQKNTKPCPTCKVSIEKNQGCNHMNCSLCRTAFCWLCLSVLRTHSEAHACNAYDPLQSAGNDSERRALFFTERFRAHEEAEEFTRKRLQHFDEDGDSVAERLWYASGEQLNNLYDAMEALAEARRFLQYSYVAAWAIQSDSPHAARFTQLQATLENVTERLSHISFQNLEPVYRDEGPGGVKSHFKTIGFLVVTSKMCMHRMSLLGQQCDMNRKYNEGNA